MMKIDTAKVKLAQDMLIDIADALQAAGGSVNMLKTVLLQDFILTCAQNNIHIEVKFGGTNGIS